MKRSGLVGVTVLQLALAAPAVAQMIGNPVYFDQSGGVVTVGADYGRGLNNHDLTGEANYFGGRVTLGLPIVAITVGGGSAQPSGGAGMTS